MKSWHLTVSSLDRLPVARTEGARRSIVLKLVQVLGPWLVLFCIVDDHLHAVVHCHFSKLSRLRTAMALAVRPLAEATTGPAHAKLVRGRGHLQWLIEYQVTQTEHHDVDVHPARWSGSCFYDLVGARVIDGFRPLIFELLPRQRPAHVLRSAGIDPGSFVPASDDTVRAAGAAALVNAAATAVASPRRGGRSAVVMRARRAAAQLGAEVGLADDELGWALRAEPRVLRRLRRAPVEPEVLRAARLQLTLAGMDLRARPRPQPRRLAR